MIFDNNYFEPKDFTYWPQLERKIYKFFHSVNTKYVYANDNSNGVRMLLIKYNNQVSLYYCVNSKGNAVIPKLIEIDGEDMLKEDYLITVEKDKNKTNVNFFIDNLGRNDQVRTHKHAFIPDEISDDEIKQILQDYFQ